MLEVGELYDKDVECPICDNEFKTKKVRTSRLRLVKRDGDFLSYYKGENPIKYSIFICPNCGYAGSESNYESVTDENKKIILNEITPRWNKRSFGNKRSIDEALVTYKLAFHIGQLLDYKKIEQGFLSLNIAGLYRMKESEEELRFLKITKDLFEEGYKRESLVGTNMDELKLSYLIGEINRRLGNEDFALKWFNLVISNPEIQFNSMLETMVRGQWSLIREDK